jgi:hypothetical protein
MVDTALGLDGENLFRRGSGADAARAAIGRDLLVPRPRRR